MAAVTAQDSHETNTWNTYASWKADGYQTFNPSVAEGTTTISSDYESLGISADS